MPVVDALTAAAQSVLPDAGPLGGALVEETALIARWLAHPGVRIVRTATGYCSPVGAAGRLSAWASAARSARVASEQLSDPDLRRSEFLGEPRPTREQLFGRPGVDRVLRPREPGLPGRDPLGVAG